MIDKLNFNYHEQQSNIFQLCNFARMLLSRLMSKMRLLNHSSMLLAQYGQKGQPYSYSLQSKIFGTSTFGQFFKVFVANRDHFNGQIFGIASKHLNGLINNNKERLNFQEAIEVGKAIETIDITQIPQKSIIPIISILRNLKTKGLLSQNLNNFKNQLAQKYVNTIKQKSVQEQNMSELINAYFEIISLKNAAESKIIADKIQRVLDNDLSIGKISINGGQISFLLYSLSLRPDLSLTEIKIRTALLKQIQREFDSFKLYEIVKIASSLNKMSFYDLEGDQFSIVKQLTDKIFNNITELEENNIYDLIRGDFNSKFYGFYKIYEEINKSLFDSFDQKGQTDLSHQAIFKILTNLSDKIPLQKVPAPSQSKFLLFLDQFAQYCAENEKNQKLFSVKVQELVKNNYFVGEQRDKLIKIIKKHKITLNLNTLYEFTVKGYNTRVFTNNILEYKQLNTENQQSMLKIGVITNKLKEQDAEANNLFTEVQKKFSEILSTPEKFIQFYNKVNRNRNFNLNQFNTVFGHLFARLPNPIQKPQTQIPNYRALYLQYIQNSYRGKQYNQFLNKNESLITCEDFIRLLNNHLAVTVKPEFKKTLIIQLGKRANQIVESKNKKWIQSLIYFLAKHNKYVVNGTLDNYSQSLIFKTLHFLVNRYDVLAETATLNSFLTMLQRYLARNTRRYNIEHNYRGLIRHLLSFIEKISTTRSRVAATVIEQALRLELLTKKSLENVDIQKLSLRYLQRARALYIKDNTYTPTIEKISSYSLQVILSNHNLEDLVTKNEAKIIETVRNAHQKDLAYYLSIYNLNKSYASKKVFHQILNQSLERINSFQRVDITGIFQNALQKNFFTYTQYKKFTEKVIEQYKKKIGNYSIESHMELIKFIVSQPGLNPKDYYSELVQFAFKKENSVDYINDQLLVRLAGTNYSFKQNQLKRVQEILQRNINTGIYFFLALQNSYEESARSAIVTSFVNKYKESIENKKSDKKQLKINHTYYLYLKKKYPNQTATLQIDQSNLHFERFSSKPRDEELITKIKQLSGSSCEQLKIFGTENHVYQVKNFVFLFINNRKLGSYYEHDFIKRVLKVLVGEDIVTGCIYSTNNQATALQYINKLCPGIFQQSQFEKAINEARNAAKEKLNKKRSEVVEES